MLALVKKLLPARLKRAMLAEICAQKAPKMIWGYQDASGEFRKRTRMSDTVLLYHSDKIYISDNVFIGHYNILDGVGGLTIGEGTQLAASVQIFTHSSHIAIRLYGDHYQDVPEYEKQAYYIAPVNIGKYVFIGASAKVFSGVAIGDGALIHAGTIVSKNVDEYQIVSGNPAKVIGDTRELDKPYLTDPQLQEWYNAWQKK